MELSGKDPAIVFSDADIELAAKRIAKGVVSFSGQRCDAIRIIAVEETVYDEFKEKLIKEIKKYKLGDTRDKSNDLGPLITEEAVIKIENAIKDAVAKGGRILVGGNRRANYHEVTLIETQKEILHDLKAINEDIFGPLTLIVKARNSDEAIEIANITPYGLDASVFGYDDAKVRKAIRYLEVGSVL